MSVKYYQASKVKAANLQGTINRVVRLTGYTEHPQNKVYGQMTNSIEIYQGDARILRISIRDQDLNVVDLNGATAKLYIAETSTSPTYLIMKTTSVIGDGAITDPANGEVSLYLTSADSAQLSTGQYFYLVQVILSTGAKYTVLNGLLNVSYDLGVQPIPPPDPETCLNMVDLTAGISSYTVTFTGSYLVLGPTLVAPSGSSENVYVTNVVYSTNQAVVYFSTALVETGWKMSYLLLQAT